MTFQSDPYRILSAETFRGYVETRYRLTLNGTVWEARCGRIDLPFDAALRAAGVSTWAFWTAWNPRSQLLSTEENLRRQAAAEEELRRAGLPYDRAVAAPDDPAWPSEPGVVEWNPSAEAALLRADRWGQRAILYGAPGAPPTLLFCDFAAAAATLEALAAGGGAAARDSLAGHAAHGG